MILIVDNNKERSKDLVVKLRIKGYIVASTQYDELWYHTKPFMTVYINPSRDEASKLINDTSTISVIFCDRHSVKLPLWSINFTSLESIIKNIENVYDEKCIYQIYDKVDVVGYACFKNGRFALGGERIRLSPKEKRIVSFFMYQADKKFKLYDASGYIRYLNNPENNLIAAIGRINRKAKAKERVPIIKYKEDYCYFNPEIASYVCTDGPDPTEIEGPPSIVIMNLCDDF